MTLGVIVDATVGAGGEEEEEEEEEEGQGQKESMRSGGRLDVGVWVSGSWGTLIGIVEQTE